MNVNITIGQYYPSNSIIHKLDPRTKIIFVFVFVLSCMFINSFIAYAFISAFLFFIFKLSKIPIKIIFKGLKGIILIMIFTSILNMLFFDGDSIIFEFYIFKITYEGIISSLKIIWRLFLIFSGASILTFVTTPIEITDGIEKIMKPLNNIGVPVHDIAIMISIAIRFIPIILEEAYNIKNAQMSRGADFDDSNIFKRVKSFIPILIPLFVSSFKRADELADSMESRCYGMNVKRSRMKELVFSILDYYSAIIIIIYLLFVFIINHFCF